MVQALSLYPPDDNCKRCKDVEKCDCACHEDTNLSKYPHIFHLKQFTGHTDENFKLLQLEQLRKRFPELGEQKILEMYKQNLY